MSVEESKGPVPEQEPLLRRFLVGDAAAYRTVERWASEVIRYRLYRIPREEREDILQLAVTAVWRSASRSGFELRKGLRPFVRTVALRRCVEWLRRYRPAKELDDTAPDPRPGPLETLEQGDEQARLVSAIRKLDDRCREIVRLHFFENLGYAAIAVQFERAEATMRVHMFNCMKALRRLMMIPHEEGSES